MVYFNYYNVMLNADIQSFKVLESKVGNVSKDKKYVYFRDKIVEGVDAETFVFFRECFTGEYYRECDHTFYAKDKNHIYYVDNIDKSFKIIKTKNVDQFCFKVIDELGYAFEEKYQYLFGKRKRRNIFF